MIFFKRTYLNILLPLIGTTILASCNKNNEQITPNSYTEIETELEGAEIELSLESSLEDDARALTFNQSDARKPEVEVGGIDVLCIIRSNKNDQPIYKTIKWQRDAKIKNRIYLRKHRFKFPKGTKTAKGKKWYILGVIGGNWNEAQKRLSFSTNRVSNTDKTRSVTLDVPAVSKWVEIPTEANGDFIFQKEGKKVVYSQIPFHSQGAFVQHRIDQNTSGHDMTVSSFSVVSTAFSFEGYYDLSTNNLPPVGNTRVGHKHGEVLRWVAGGENTNKEYAETNKSIKEYSHEFTLPAPIKIGKGAKATANQVATFWVMPTGVSTDKARTNVFVKATASGGSYTPKVLRLPSYGKNHASVLRTGDLAKLTSIMHRPKLGIEYMAEYNIKRKVNGADWGANGTRKPSGSTNQLATNHGRDAVSGLTYDEATAAADAISGYHLPNKEEWSSVLPMGVFQASSTISGPKTFSATTVKAQVGNSTADYQYQIRQTPPANGKGVGTIYALHFVDNKNGNKMRVAYRYSSIPNPFYQNEIGKRKEPTSVRMKEAGYPVKTSTQDERSGLPVYPFTVQAHHATYLKIDMIYLGAYFLGKIEDISNDQWWNDTARSSDMVTRYLSSNVSEFIGYTFFSGSIILNRRRVGGTFTQFLYPSSAFYWLQGDKVPGNGEIQQYFDKNRQAYRFFTDTGESTHASFPDVTGLSVRLFSDN